MTTIQVQPIDINKDGKISAWELWVSTLMMYVYLVILVGSFVGMIAILCLSISPIVKGLALVFCIPACIIAFVGYNRQARYERMEQIARQEKELEIERAKFELAQIKGVSTTEQNTRWTQSQVDYYARLWLNHYYNTGTVYTRSRWMNDGLPKEAWDHINGLMQKYKIRKGKKGTLEFENFASAWGQWCDKIMTSRNWIKSGDELLQN